MPSLNMKFPAVLRRVAALLIVAFAVASCATQPPPQFPELRFTHLPPITIGVAKIQIVDARNAASSGNHVEARMPRSPADAVRNWAQDRLQANGVSGVAIFTIEDASVVETNLKTTGGIKGAFTNDQAERYDGRIRATLRLENVPRVTQAYADAAVEHSQTIAENATINDREQVWFDLTEALMKAFDPAMSTSIRQHLADYVR